MSVAYDAKSEVIEALTQAGFVPEAATSNALSSSVRFFRDAFKVTVGPRNTIFHERDEQGDYQLFAQHATDDTVMVIAEIDNLPASILSSTSSAPAAPRRVKMTP